MSNSARDMIQMDIHLKEELNVIFSRFLRRQTISLILASFCSIGVILLFLFYFLKPSKIDSMTFKAIQHERIMIRAERDSLKNLITEWKNLRTKK